MIASNNIYLLIKYIKSVLWRVAKRLSYIEEARCLKVKRNASGIVLLHHGLHSACTSSGTGQGARGVRRNTAQPGDTEKNFPRYALDDSQRRRAIFIQLSIIGEQLRASLSVWMDFHSQSSFSVTKLSMRLEQSLIHRWPDFWTQ